MRTQIAAIKAQTEIKLARNAELNAQATSLRASGVTLRAQVKERRAQIAQLTADVATRQNEIAQLKSQRQDEEQIIAVELTSHARACELAAAHGCLPTMPIAPILSGGPKAILARTRELKAQLSADEIRIAEHAARARGSGLFCLAQIEELERAAAGGAAPATANLTPGSQKAVAYLAARQPEFRPE